MSFEALALSPLLIKGLNAYNITKPTPIQEEVIPLIKEGFDVVGISRTGSGKTAAFGLPLLEKVEPGKGIQALVLSPTRELAVQIANELQRFSKFDPKTIVTIYGGVAIEPQMKALQTADIVIGTPGRVLDHLTRDTMNLSSLKIFVLDEADKMVDMGFIHDITKILEATPKKKQILLFGATIDREIKQLQQRHMRDVHEVKVATHVQKDLLQQFYYNVPRNEKFSLLVHLLRHEPLEKVIIFASTIRMVEVLTYNLQRQGIQAEMLHGKLTQARRLKIVKAFNEGNQNILVASPVAARGLHIHNVTHVINFDLASDPQEYIHRIGRTARAGKTGKAITLLSKEDHDVFSRILDQYKIPIESLPLVEFPSLPFTFQVPDQQQRRNHRFAQRKNNFQHGSTYSRMGRTPRGSFSDDENNRSYARSNAGRRRPQRGYARGRSDSSRGFKQRNFR